MTAAFLVVCSILQWKMSRSDSFSVRQDDEFICVLLNQLLIECPSAILDMFWFLWQPWKYIKESCWKKQPFLSCHRRLARLYNLGQNIWHKVKKFSKIGQDFRNLYLILHVLWQLLSKFNYWKENWALGRISTQIWYFFNVS